MTREQLGTLILDSERQLYSTAKTILSDDHDCADAIQETIVKAFSKIEMHMAQPNGRVCGAKRPKCEAERSHHL